MDVANLLYEAMSVKLSVTFMFCGVFSIDQSSYLDGSFLLIYIHIFFYTVLVHVFCVLRHTLHYNF